MTFPEPIREKGLQYHFKESGIDYKLFIKMVESKASISAITRAFNKSRPTIKNWIRIYEEEKAERGLTS